MTSVEVMWDLFGVLWHYSKIVESSFDAADVEYLVLLTCVSRRVGDGLWD